jgi:hypothetical protein
LHFSRVYQRLVLGFGVAAKAGGHAFLAPVVRIHVAFVELLRRQVKDSLLKERLLFRRMELYLLMLFPAKIFFIFLYRLGLQIRIRISI